MFCIQCGAKIKNNSTFCENCGADQCLTTTNIEDEKTCPRCHKLVPNIARCCPYCHMLLTFCNDKPTIYDNVLTNEEQFETPENIIEETDLCTDSTTAHHDYLAGFFFVIDKMLGKFFIGIVILIVLFFMIGPLAALPLLIFKDKDFLVLIVALFIATPFIGAYTYRTGKCPYCGEDLSGIPQSNGLTCKTCENRVLVKDDRFYKINK